MTPQRMPAMKFQPIAASPAASIGDAIFASPCGHAGFANPRVRVFAGSPNTTRCEPAGALGVGGGVEGGLGPANGGLASGPGLAPAGCVGGCDGGADAAGAGAAAGSTAEGDAAGDGASEGALEGASGEGDDEGDGVECTGVGAGIGVGVGAGVGATVGASVGAGVGVAVGACVGVGVGVSVAVGAGVDGVLLGDPSATGRIAERMPTSSCARASGASATTKVAMSPATAILRTIMLAAPSLQHRDAAPCSGAAHPKCKRIQLGEKFLPAARAGPPHAKSEPYH